MPRRARPRFLACEAERPRLVVPVPQLLIANRQRQEEAVPAVARREGVLTCVEIKILRSVRSTAWRCLFLTARPSQDGRAIAEK